MLSGLYVPTCCLGLSKLLLLSLLLVITHFSNCCQSSPGSGTGGCGSNDVCRQCCHSGLLLLLALCACR